MQSGATKSAVAIRPQYRDVRHFFWIGLYIYVGFALHSAWAQHDSIALILLSLSCFIPLGVIAHELAHALTAAFVGGRVQAIRLGLTQVPTGPHLSFRFLGFPCSFLLYRFQGRLTTSILSRATTSELDWCWSAHQAPWPTSSLC